MESLHDTLAAWQHRLGLTDWEISLEIRDPAVFDDKGHIAWDGDAKTALITLRSGDADITETLIHELLHLHFVDCEISLNILEPFLGAIALDVAKRQMQLGIERAVAKLTTAFSSA